MRGVPGSSKSTIAQFISEGWIKKGYTAIIHSTDNYFMKDGTYQFDRSLLFFNHKRNFEACIESMKSGINCIIIDNTNINRKDYKDYINEGILYGYEYQEINVNTPLETCIKRNDTRSTDRKIPIEIIQDMYKRLNP
jgi:tRNA uridine 5-carbamoylmethylation protein Kti12